ncbi:hypothetical protein [Nocardia gipuzkoensis]
MLDVQNVDATAILVTADLPDEALLALLDLDPAWPGLAWPGLHGKVLGWNTENRQWAPVDLSVTQVIPLPGAWG